LATFDTTCLGLIFAFIAMKSSIQIAPESSKVIQLSSLIFTQTQHLSFLRVLQLMALRRSSRIKVYLTSSPCDNESVTEALSAASLTKSSKTLELRAFYVNKRGPVVLLLKGWSITGRNVAIDSLY